MEDTDLCEDVEVDEFARLLGVAKRVARGRFGYVLPAGVLIEDIRSAI